MDAAPTPTPVRIEADGIRHYGEWLGAPRAGAPTLVFLHDGLGSVETWRGLPGRVAGALGLPAFAFDRWGYGRSDEREHFPSLFMNEEAHRLEHVLDGAGIGARVLIGHSDGGSIALLNAAWYPARVRAVVSVAAHLYPDRVTIAGCARLHAMAVSGDLPPWMERFHGARARRLMLAWSDIWQREDFRRWTIAGDIRAIAAPVLALQGEDDEYGLPDQLDDLARAVPHAETALLPGLGHFPHVAAPELVAARIVAFLRGRV